MYHALTWPCLQYVADCGDGKIVGYVLAKIDERAAVLERSEDNNEFVSPTATFVVTA